MQRQSGSELAPLRRERSAGVDAARRGLSIFLLACWGATLAACEPLPQYSYRSRHAGVPEQPLPPVEARVVSAREAAQSGLVPRPLVISFAGPRDGTELVTRFLADADRARAHLISELAIVIESNQDGRSVECRTEIVPESVTERQLRAGTYKMVSVQRPVQRTVTEFEQRCRPVMRSELRSYTDYEQRCGSVSRPETRTRTVYSTQYDYFSKSFRSEPHTEMYTTYESHYECKSTPVTRQRSELVSKTECGSELVTKMVTRYEFQLESQYIPPHMETVTRQRLRELEPVCYEIDADADADTAGAAEDGVPAPSARARGNRIEGRIYTKR